MLETSPTYQQIARAIEYLMANYQQQPSLFEAAETASLSEYHFQRLFTDWAGVSPKKFLQYLTLTHARDQLRHGLTVAEVAEQAGLSGTGRLHDLFVTLEGLTPGQARQGGAGLALRYGVFDSPFGPYALGAFGDKIARLDFLEEGDIGETITERMAAYWPAATLVADPVGLQPLADSIFTATPARPLRLLVRGSDFQVKVWEALLKIPEGRVVSYDQLAAAVGMPTASRAVGTAVGANPVGYLIPCHRVIRKTGIFGQYRWGSLRKTAMLGWEAARTQPAEKQMSAEAPFLS
ncbi:methylated-DNA--[protein]-cysteine S-methyltransferase [Tellurirhabdus rosea]|uniref:methylated-DNA--[protein]-cysteine S-methyltransferase n=1 Tax=Tellurirhabdus rosea TaxID=2674997 RepID=UPI00224CCBC4|nr:methylated-DNA--[protein]-cysteine S-methyltransferase [Tellurirhabdus rosea]